MEIQNDRLVVHYERDEPDSYDILELARTWRRKSNDVFFERYQFDWPFELLGNAVSIDEKGMWPVDNDD